MSAREDVATSYTSEMTCITADDILWNARGTESSCLSHIAQEEGLFRISFIDAQTPQHLAIRRKSGMTDIFTDDTRAVLVQTAVKKAATVNRHGFAHYDTPKPRTESGSFGRLFIPENRQSDTTSWVGGLVVVAQRAGIINLHNTSPALKGYTLLNSTLNRIFNYAKANEDALAQLREPEGEIALPAIQLDGTTRQLYLRTVSQKALTLVCESSLEKLEGQEAFAISRQQDGRMAVGFGLLQQPSPSRQGDEREYDHLITLANDVLPRYFQRLGAVSGDKDILAAGVTDVRRELGSKSLEAVLEGIPRSSTISF